MRTLSANFEAAKNQQYGAEPVMILAVDWNGVDHYYCDKEYSNCDPRIVSLSNIEFVYAKDDINEMSVVLNNTDNAITNIIQSFDAHKRPCKIYMSFTHIAFEDKLLLFTGQLASAFTQDETDKTIKFNIMSSIETYEVGFSPEESGLELISKDMESVPWPVGFGKNVHAPAVRIRSRPTGELEELICIIDPTLAGKKEQLLLQHDMAQYVEVFWRSTLNGTKEVMPEVLPLEKEYLRLIEEEDIGQIALAEIETELADLKQILLNNPKNPLAEDDRRVWQQRLEEISPLLDEKLKEKEARERDISIVEYYVNLMKQASSSVTDAHNSKREIFAEIMKVEQAYCEQLNCVKNQVQLKDHDDLPKNQDIEVTIKGVKFTVNINDDGLMTILASNTLFYQDVVMAPWTQDDEPCSQYDILNGVNLFHIQDPTIDLTNKWLLVKRVGSEQRHIIHVTDQRGTKVYFDLVEWDRQGSGSYPRKPGLEQAIGNLLQPDTPKVFPNVPANTGTQHHSNFNQRQRQRFEQLISALPNPPNDQEAQNIAKLVVFEQYDNLNYNSLFDRSILPDVVIGDSHPSQVYTIIGSYIDEIEEVAGLIKESWLIDYDIVYEEVPSSHTFSAEPGTVITQETCEIHVVNIFPSTIKAVYAYRENIDGARYLAPVPSSYYTKYENYNLGTMNGTFITLERPLPPGERWEDTLHVTFESSIEGKFTDIISTIATEWTNLTPDSYTALDTIATNHPMNFVLYDRMDAMTLIREVATQARCGVFTRDGTLYIKYLSSEPASDKTITSVIQNSITYSHTNTEDLMTVIKGEWRENYVDDADRKITLRYNVKDYGRHTENYDFFTYAHRELVEKSLTFWLIRRANTYRRITFSVPLTHVELDLLDTVTFNGVKSVLQSMNFDHENRRLILSFEQPIRSGESVPYIFYWPTSLDPSITWPTSEDIASGKTGNFGPGTGVEGDLPCG